MPVKYPPDLSEVSRKLTLDGWLNFLYQCEHFIAEEIFVKKQSRTQWLVGIFACTIMAVLAIFQMGGMATGVITILLLYLFVTITYPFTKFFTLYSPLEEYKKAVHRLVEDIVLGPTSVNSVSVWDLTLLEAEHYPRILEILKKGAHINLEEVQERFKIITEQFHKYKLKGPLRYTYRRNKLLRQIRKSHPKS